MYLEYITTSLFTQIKLVYASPSLSAAIIFFLLIFPCSLLHSILTNPPANKILSIFNIQYWDSSKKTQSKEYSCNTEILYQETNNTQNTDCNSNNSISFLRLDVIL